MGFLQINIYLIPPNQYLFVINYEQMAFKQVIHIFLIVISYLYNTYAHISLIGKT